MKASWMQRSMLASSVMLTGCELGVEQLEGGDEADEPESGDATDELESSEGDGDGDDDGDGDAPSDECVVQGTNIDGGSDPLDHPMPECEVECATGWGHGAPPLAVEWTLDLEHELGAFTSYTYLARLPNDELLTLITWIDAPARLVWASAEGELLAELTQPAIDREVLDLDVDAAGTVYALSRDDDTHSLIALSSSGEHLWTVELGPQESYGTTIDAMDSGVLVALNAPTQLEAGQLLQVSAAGQVTTLLPIPHTQQIALSPSGDTVAVASNTTIRWANLSELSWTSIVGIADVHWLRALVAIDDESVVNVGTSRSWGDGFARGYIKQVGPMGLVWEGRYDRAFGWCGQMGPTDEEFADIARLTDGSLIVAGSETGSSPDTPYIFQQPIVFHVSAGGEVLGTDRGFWEGEAVAAVAGSDGSAYALMHRFTAWNTEQHLHVRKYTF